jgi:Flp pilus assembly protein TadG
MAARCRSNERGQALVEFTLVVPLLVLLLFGIVEAGRIGNAYLTVTHAARHGARYGAVGADNGQITARVADSAAALNPSSIQTNISRTGDDIRVTVAYPIHLITPVISGIVPNPVLVSSAVVMRME